MRLVEALPSIRYYINTGQDMSEGEYLCQRSIPISFFPCVERRIQEFFLFRIPGLRNLVESEQHHLESDESAFLALKCITARYSSGDTPVAYRDIFDCNRAWNTIWRYFEPEEKEYIDDFFCLFYGDTQIAYKHLVDDLIRKVITKESPDESAVVEAVARLQNALEVPVYALPREQWNTMIDDLTECATIEPRADAIATKS
jgi:hypothetical protein